MFFGSLNEVYGRRLVLFICIHAFILWSWSWNNLFITFKLKMDSSLLIFILLFFIHFCIFIIQILRVFRGHFLLIDCKNSCNLLRISRSSRHLNLILHYYPPLIRLFFQIHSLFIFQMNLHEWIFFCILLFTRCVFILYFVKFERIQLII